MIVGRWMHFRIAFSSQKKINQFSARVYNIHYEHGVSIKNKHTTTNKRASYNAFQRVCGRKMTPWRLTYIDIL